MNPTTPVPHDLPLALPAPEPILVVVLVGFFLMHILFINMMVGGTFLTFLYQALGLKNPKWDAVAHDLASTITVNKSIAVVLGVGPLLAINTLYTMYFYTANALTADFWISIIPLVFTAFLLTYAHKYLWGRMPQWLHLATIAVVVAIFAFVPLIFLTNITLMLQPERWIQVAGFWDAIQLPNVWTRYAHFMLACPAMTGLMMVWMYRRRSADSFANTGLTKPAAIRLGYHWALWPTVGQFVVGPLSLMTLPKVPGDTSNVTAVFLMALLVTISLCLLIWREIRQGDSRIGSGFGSVAGVMFVVVLLMGSGRHMYREAAVDEHRTAVAAKTETFRAASAAAHARAAAAATAETQ